MYFTEIFYLALEMTKVPSQALTLTKKAFVEEYPEYSNPYYWAGFVQYGY